MELREGLAQKGEQMNRELKTSTINVRIRPSILKKVKEIAKEYNISTADTLAVCIESAYNDIKENNVK